MNRSVLLGLFKAQLRVFTIALLNGPLEIEGIEKEMMSHELGK
jgi:hypothetical protein